MTSKRKPRDTATLPKWAQKLFLEQQQQISRLLVLAQAYEVLMNRDWFVITGQTPQEHYPRKLWWLDHDQPFPCCTLGEGDVLLVGRRKAVPDGF